MKQTEFKKILILLYAIFIAVLFSACEKDESYTIPPPVEEEEEEIPVPVIEINKFIHDYMEVYYLWNENMPNLDYTSQPDSKEYFDSLLYKPTDRWSFITDDYEALANSYQGIEESMGHSFILYTYSNSDGVFGVIQFVYPGSPAWEAELKRGDFFTAIDGIDLDTENYKDLLNQTSYTITIAERQGNVVVPIKDVIMTARIITQNPILLYDTLNIEGTSIGYLVYKNFLDNYNDSLTTAFSWLSLVGIDEMILDLRYNNGGAITSMQHLSSILAPAQQVNNNDIIIEDMFNTNITNYYSQNGLSRMTRFEDVGINLNLSRLYVLTGDNTASASEALIIGLEPYMDVVTLGSQTHGKYTGAYLLYDTEGNHNWAIQPITFKYANSVGFTDFTNGLSPAFYREDDLYTPLGDPNEGLLSLAIQQITGVPAAVATKSAELQLGAVPFKSFDFNKIRKEIPLIREKIDLKNQ